MATITDQDAPGYGQELTLRSEDTTSNPSIVANFLNLQRGAGHGSYEFDDDTRKLWLFHPGQRVPHDQNVNSFKEMWKGHREDGCILPPPPGKREVLREASIAAILGPRLQPKTTVPIQEQWWKRLEIEKHGPSEKAKGTIFGQNPTKFITNLAKSILTGEETRPAPTNISNTQRSTNEKNSSVKKSKGRKKEKTCDSGIESNPRVLEDDDRVVLPETSKDKSSHSYEQLLNSYTTSQHDHGSEWSTVGPSRTKPTKTHNQHNLPTAAKAPTLEAKTNTRSVGNKAWPPPQSPFTSDRENAKGTSGSFLTWRPEGPDGNNSLRSHLASKTSQKLGSSRISSSSIITAPTHNQAASERNLDIKHSPDKTPFEPTATSPTCSDKPVTSPSVGSHGQHFGPVVDTLKNQVESSSPDTISSQDTPEDATKLTDNKSAALQEDRKKAGHSPIPLSGVLANEDVVTKSGLPEDLPSVKVNLPESQPKQTASAPSKAAKSKKARQTGLRSRSPAFQAVFSPLKNTSEGKRSTIGEQQLVDSSESPKGDMTHQTYKPPESRPSEQGLVTCSNRSGDSTETMSRPASVHSANSSVRQFIPPDDHSLDFEGSTISPASSTGCSSHDCYFAQNIPPLGEADSASEPLLAATYNKDSIYLFHTNAEVASGTRRETFWSNQTFMSNFRENATTSAMEIQDDLIEECIKERAFSIAEASSRAKLLEQPFHVDPHSIPMEESALMYGESTCGLPTKPGGKSKPKIVLQFPYRLAYSDVSIISQMIASRNAVSRATTVYAVDQLEEAVKTPNQFDGAADGFETYQGTGNELPTLGTRPRSATITLPYCDTAMSCLMVEQVPMMVTDDPPGGDDGYRYGTDWRGIRDPSEVEGRRHSFTTFEDELQKDRFALELLGCEGQDEIEALGSGL